MKKSLRVLILLFTLVLFSQCACHKNQSSVDQIPVKDAYYFDWVGGVQGTSGTTVVIELESNPYLTPEYLYFNQLKAELENHPKRGETHWIARLESAKKIPLQMSKNRQDEYGNTPPADGINLKLKPGEAMIQYKKAGEVHYYKLDSIRKEKPKQYL